MKKLSTAAIFLLSALFISPAGRSDFFGCHEMIVAGKKQFEIDAMYLIKTRMLNDLDDNSTIRMSKFIHSDISQMDFTKKPDADNQFIVNINAKNQADTVVDGWVSDRTRDGVCALELEGWKEKQYINEYMQILAIYPGGTLALGLPNTENRVGLIFLINEGGYNPFKVSQAPLDLFTL